MSRTSHAYWFVPFRHVAADDLEGWFEAMARQGRAPRRLGQWSSLRMRLAPAPPRTTRYVVDLQARPGRDYLTVFGDAGWEHVGQMASMHVWRRDYEGTRPEAFTDRAGRTARDRRLALAVLPSAVVFLIVTVALATAAGFADPADRLQLGLAAGFSALATAAVTAAAAVQWRASRH